jgi:predicted RNase H-like nuclease (RuvC/YqgF family)
MADEFGLNKDESKSERTYSENDVQSFKDQISDLKEEIQGLKDSNKKLKESKKAPQVDASEVDSLKTKIGQHTLQIDDLNDENTSLKRELESSKKPEVEVKDLDEMTVDEVLEALYKKSISERQKILLEKYSVAFQDFVAKMGTKEGNELVGEFMREKIEGKILAAHTSKADKQK